MFVHFITFRADFPFFLFSLVLNSNFAFLLRPDLEKRKAEKAQVEAKRREANMARLQKDLDDSKGQNVVLSAPRRMEDGDEEDELDEEEEEEEDDDDDANGEEERGDEVFREIGGRL